MMLLSTLEETVLADLIVHVVDASEPEQVRREAIVAVIIPLLVTLGLMKLAS